MSYIIGIDGGTESLRAFVIDLQGTVLASHATAYETTFPAAAMAEQSPETWWHAIAESVKGAMTKASVSAEDIKALAFDGTCCTVVALDADNKPLRPALLWMDVRAHMEADAVAATGDAALRVNGDSQDPVSAEWMIPKALWIKRNQPELFAASHRICEYQEYINLRLTGRYVGSLLTASIRWHYHAENGFPDSLLAQLDLAELREKWPKEMIAPGEVVGGLTAEAASHLGLKVDTPVAQGGADAMIGMIGLGVVEAGELALITGSSHLHLGLSTHDVHKQGVFGSYRDAVYPGLNLLEGGQTSTGSVIAWFKRQFAEAQSYEELNKAAALIEPGCEGIRALDHFQGNRTPYVDPLSRGALTGLSLNHTPAHVYRAIIESICLGTRVIVDSFETEFSRIVVAGGATNSDLWMQIHADTLQLPLQVTEVSDAPGLGCGILASVACGAYPNVKTACKEMVKVSGQIEPDTTLAGDYAMLLEEYRQLYHSMKQMREQVDGDRA